MTCATMFVFTVTFNGINHTPINSTAMIKLGGEVASEGVMNNAGRRSAGIKVEESEVEFEIPNDADFSIANYRGICGDLMFLTRDGASYLCTNAQLAANPELKDGDPKIKLSFKGDAAVPY